MSHHALAQDAVNATAAPLAKGRDRPARVLYFDHTAMLGGGEIALLNLIRYVDRNCVTPVVVLCSDGPLAEHLRDICEVHILGFPARVRTMRKDGLGWTSLLRLRDVSAVLTCSVQLARFAAKRDIDLIHTNSLKADIIGGLAGLMARRPVVWHVRDRIESDYLPKPVVGAFRLLAGLLPSYVITNSQAVLKTLRLKRNLWRAVIPSGVDLAKRSRVVHDATVVPSESSVQMSGRKPLIALIGRICPWKGQHIFLHAAAMVRRRFPNATFKIVGAALFGEQEYEEQIRRLRTELGLDDAVELTGFCRDIPRFIPEVDIVVHASTTGEPFGQVIIEAMAASKPVVATDGGGVPEIVVDSVTGLLVPMGDAAAMADAICRLVGDPAAARRMGLEGFARVREFFTIEHTVRKVQGVYRQLLEAQ